MGFFKRFTDIDDKGTKVNFLIYPFFLATLAYGIGFTCFGWASGVHASSLWTAMSSLHPFIPVLWGLAALIAVVLAGVLITTRLSGFGDFAALFGAMVWIFAIGCYIATSGWLLIFAVGLPNLGFWAWYYLRLSHFKRFGIPTPPS